MQGSRKKEWCGTCAKEHGGVWLENRDCPGPCSLVARVCSRSRYSRVAVCPARGARGVGDVGDSRSRAAPSSRYGFNGWVRPPPKPPEPEILTLLAPHVVVLCSPNFRCGLTPISDPGCPQLKNYYSPIWIAMRWYKARAFMRHHKTSEPRQRRLPIKHKGLIPFSSKLVIQHLPSFFCTLVPRMPV